MCYKILNLIAVLTLAFSASAQFHTITKEKGIPYVTEGKKSYIPEIEDNKTGISDTLSLKPLEDPLSGSLDSVIPETLKCYTYTSPNTAYSYAKARKRKPRSIPKDGVKETYNNLPELTIPNLYTEIKKNNIKYPKIVLAQAILETGWFKSAVCRNKNNLFGLTNPRTKTYYEFDHWTESVTAYRTKVQYKYKGGNYLLWLRDIGYAEDKGYIQAVIRVLRQL
ncbi:MAG: glucosaminidase domain-containing protein [Lachnospiraceae bacterium]|nr:glucosaminidase domain-containing protein [Lachnospiraceae bacterium]